MSILLSLKLQSLNTLAPLLQLVLDAQIKGRQRASSLDLYISFQQCAFYVHARAMLQRCMPLTSCLSCAGKTLLNLDTEDWGEIFIGCAGGGDSMITLPVQHESLDSSSADAYTITVSGILPSPCLCQTLPCTYELALLECAKVKEDLGASNDLGSAEQSCIRVLGSLCCSPEMCVRQLLRQCTSQGCMKRGVLVLVQA